jgi:hypothetical protein
VIPDRPPTARTRGRIRFRCRAGHEITRVTEPQGRPVCQECSGSSQDLVFMDRVKPGS